MGYFDGLANSSFKKDAEGRDLFFPNGMLGKGRVLPDAETAEELRRKIVGFYKGLMFGGVPLMVVLANVPHGIPIVIALAAVAAIGTFLYFRHLTQGLPIAGERLGYMEAQRNAARGHSYFGLIALAIISWLFTTGGVILLLVGGPEARWVALLCTLFFGAGLAVFVWMIVAKKRQGAAAADAATPGPRGSSAVSRNDRGRI